MQKRDLTQGPVFSTILTFALPMLLGNLLQQAYNITDTWVVGRFVSADALAGVGSAFSLMNLITAVLLGLSMGSGIVFALHFGAKANAALEKSAANAFWFIGSAAGILTVLPLTFLEDILTAMNIPPEIRGLIRSYLRIVFLGTPAIFLYNYFGAYLRSVGNSLVPLVFLSAATVLNIALDFLLVAGLSLGIPGAAAATVIAQYVSGGGLCLYALCRDGSLRRALSSIRPSFSGIRELAGYSIFTCLQQSMMKLGVLMVQSLVNSFGTTVMAGFASAAKIDEFIYMPAQEYANAFSTFTAQNLGAHRQDRVKKGIICAFATSACYCMVMSVVLRNLAGPLIGIFVAPEEANRAAIIASGVEYLHIEGAFYVGIGMLTLFYGLYRALGKPWFSMVLTVVSLGSRVLLAYGFAPTAGVTAIWWAVPIGWGLADLTGFVFLFLKRKKLLG